MLEEKTLDSKKGFKLNSTKKGSSDAKPNNKLKEEPSSKKDKAKMKS